MVTVTLEVLMPAVVDDLSVCIQAAIWIEGAL